MSINRIGKQLFLVLLMIFSAIFAIFIGPGIMAFAKTGSMVAIGAILEISVICLFFYSIITSLKISKGIDIPKVSWESVENWNQLVSTCDYKHYWNGHGIAISSKDSTLYLKGFFNKTPIEKNYHFNDVREWKTSITSGGEVFATGNAVAGAAVINAMQGAQNFHESGLFIRVRDIDYPEWQIRFSPKDNMQTNLKKWMEILQQFLNENK